MSNQKDILQFGDQDLENNDEEVPRYDSINESKLNTHSASHNTAAFIDTEIGEGTLEDDSNQVQPATIELNALGVRKRSISHSK